MPHQRETEYPITNKVLVLKQDGWSLRDFSDTHTDILGLIFSYFVGEGIDVLEQNLFPSLVSKHWNRIFNSTAIWGSSPLINPANNQVNLSSLIKLELKSTGTEGTCFKCLKRQTGKVVLLAQAHKYNGQHTVNDGIPYHTLRMASALRSMCEHPNVCKLLEIGFHDNIPFCFFEYYPYSLNNILRKNDDDQISSILLKESADGMYQYITNLRIKRQFQIKTADGGDGYSGGFLTPPSCMMITKQVLLGLSHLHAHDIIHRNIRPKHLLIQPGPDPSKPLEGCRVVIADFSMSKMFDKTTPSGECSPDSVSLWYRPPELLMGTDRHEPPIDVWSVGCILAEMVLGMIPFRGESEIDQIFQIFRKLGTPTPEDWEEFSSLPHFSPHFPQWSSQPGNALPGLISDTLKNNEAWKMGPSSSSSSSSSFSSSSSIDGDAGTTSSSITEEFPLITGVASLVTLMLCVNPNKRISVDEALQHEFLSKQLNLLSKNESKTPLKQNEVETVSTQRNEKIKNLCDHSNFELKSMYPDYDKEVLSYIERRETQILEMVNHIGDCKAYSKIKKMVYFLNYYSQRPRALLDMNEWGEYNPKEKLVHCLQVVNTFGLKKITALAALAIYYQYLYIEKTSTKEKGTSLIDTDSTHFFVINVCLLIASKLIDRPYMNINDFSLLPDWPSSVGVEQLIDLEATISLSLNFNFFVFRDPMSKGLLFECCDVSSHAKERFVDWSDKHCEYNYLPLYCGRVSLNLLMFIYCCWRCKLKELSEVKPLHEEGVSSSLPSSQSSSSSSGCSISEKSKNEKQKIVLKWDQALRLGCMLGEMIGMSGELFYTKVSGLHKAFVEFNQSGQGQTMLEMEDWDYNGLADIIRKNEKQSIFGM